MTDVTLDDFTELIKQIRLEVREVPGKQRLLRMCGKELKFFRSLSGSHLHDAMCCSNYPFFKAIKDMACVYADRLVDLLCHYQLPVTDDFKSFGNCTDSLYITTKKQKSFMVDLICTQEHNSVTDSSVIKLAGNAADARLWAPSLWIKVVTRDSDRINHTWRGESSSIRARCLSQQAYQLSTVTKWLQRDQPHYNRPIIHWLSSSQNDDVSRLDPCLLDYLRYTVGIEFIPNAVPWSSINVASLDSIDYLNLNQRGHLPIKTFMLPNHWVWKFFQETDATTSGQVDASLKQHRLNIVDKFINMTQKIIANECDMWSTDHGHDEDGKICFPVTNAVEAVLAHSIVWPFTSQQSKNLNGYTRVNLDISALIAFAAELSHLLPPTVTITDDVSSSAPSSLVTDEWVRPLCQLKSPDRCEYLLGGSIKFENSKLHYLLELEAQVPVLSVMDQYMKGKVPIVCLTTVYSFLKLLSTVSGPAEWATGIHIISRLIIVYDITSDGTKMPLSSLSSSSKDNFLQTKRIIDIGYAYSALTITSNSTFLRSIQNSGLQYRALLLPARALTETARIKEY